MIKSSKDLTSLEFPYFMKVSLAGHKTEKKAVLKCNNLKEAKENLNFLSKKFPSKNIVIQEEVSGMEMIIGIKKDKVFGKLLMVGFGGINAETMKDVQFRAVPVSKNDIKSAVKDLKLYPSLFKRKKYAVEKFIELAAEISELDLEELDLNPVILTEKEAVIVDARAKTSPVVYQEPQ
jgi:hypothetical protein